MYYVRGIDFKSIKSVVERSGQNIPLATVTSRVQTLQLLQYLFIFVLPLAKSSQPNLFFRSSSVDHKQQVKLLLSLRTTPLHLINYRDLG